MATFPPIELPGHDHGRAEPSWNGVALLNAWTLPRILAPHSWFITAPEATFWMATFPFIFVPAPKENAADPWIFTLPPIVPFVIVKLPPWTPTFPVTPPPLTNEQFWPAETVRLPLNVPL